LAIENRGDTAAHDRVIVGEEYANRLVSQSSR
jgi:hypothetical protein